MVKLKYAGGTFYLTLKEAKRASAMLSALDYVQKNSAGKVTKMKWIENCKLNKISYTETLMWILALTKYIKVSRTFFTTTEGAVRVCYNLKIHQKPEVLNNIIKIYEESKKEVEE